jgi:hypothetical protein
VCLSTTPIPKDSIMSDSLRSRLTRCIDSTDEAWTAGIVHLDRNMRELEIEALQRKIETMRAARTAKDNAETASGSSATRSERPRPSVEIPLLRHESGHEHVSHTSTEWIRALHRHSLTERIEVFTEFKSHTESKINHFSGRLEDKKAGIEYYEYVPFSAIVSSRIDILILIAQCRG